LVFERNRSGKVGEVAEKAHYPLWKLGKYKRGAHDTIVLGDSRARALRERYWHGFRFPNAKNLAYGGGTIPEIYETFKFIKNDPAIKNLVVGIQLRSFDEDHKQGLNRVPEAISLIKKPVEYVFNWAIAKTSVKLFSHEHPHIANSLHHLPSILTNAHAAEPSVLNKHVASLEAIYQTMSLPRTLPRKFQLQVTRNARSDWRGFEFSETYWSHIEEIGRWGKENGKTVVFVIPPTILEMQQTIEAYGLSSLNIELRKRLVKQGVVIDFDYPNPLSKKVTNFTDAYHFNSKIARQIVGEIAGELSAKRSVLELVKKRRKSINCTQSASDSKLLELGEGASLSLGKNCRTWIGSI